MLRMTTILNMFKEDKLIWKKSRDGNLSFKDAYIFHTSSQPQFVSWAKSIWHAAIPPSKSLLVWRIIHGKISTDDHLAKRGLHLPSICNLCNKSEESAHHLFLNCSFSLVICNWLATTLNINCNTSNYLDLISLCDRNWSPHYIIVIHCFYAIWFCRNQKRFNDKVVNSRSTINMIISSASLSRNNTRLAANSSIYDFVILKHFEVIIKPPKAPTIKEVLWNPSIFNSVKCNTDRASLGNLGQSACGGLFRNSTSDFLGAFAINLGINSAFNSELIGVVVAIEIAHCMNWRNLWLETDSMLVFLSFKSSKIVPWHLQNRWDNCLHLLSYFNFNITHIYREGNTCVDQLATIGLSLSSHFWFTQLPSQIGLDFSKNKLGLPNFRFC